MSTTRNRESSLVGVSPRPPSRSASVTLADGRRLAWHEWGEPGGIPVLFCTGAAMSGRMGFGEEALERYGLRLIAIDRPGLGASGPDPGKTLDTWVADTRALLDELRATSPGAVGFSQGAPFALALAARGLVRTVTLVSAQDELAHRALRPRLHPDVAAMVARVAEDPKRFEADFAGFATAEGLWELIVGTSAGIDRDLYLSEAFAASYRACLEEGFRQGADGYARDLVNALGEWPFAVEDIAVPVDLWFGARDASPVHSPDFGRTLASRLQRCVHRVEPDEGGSLLWTRAEAILGTLAAHFG